MKKFMFPLIFALVMVGSICISYAEQPRKTFTNTLGMEFVLIPAGTFMIGSPSNEPGRYAIETQHRVNLTNGFYMQTTEVTQGQWRAVMGNNPSANKACGDDCPVEQVSWNDVQAFIQKLNHKEGTNKYRIPTEAEWEYACRAGSTTAFTNGGIRATKLKCGFDPNLDAMGWYCYNSGNKTHPVARKNANAWGLCDMYGNVAEWCQDWFGTYPNDEVTDPNGPSSGSYRVMRGGVWYSFARDCRSASRYGSPPHYRFYYLGFRIAKTP